MVAGWPISTVGSLYTANGAGLTTLSVNPTTIGDCLIFAPTHGQAGSTITSVTGGHCTGWTRIAGPFAATGYVATIPEIWVGVCNAIGSAANITISGASLGSPSSQRLVAQQFTTGQGAASTWVADGSPSNFEQDSTASATVVWPTLTPSGTNRMYLGRGTVSSTANTTGQTAGYTVALDAGSNPFFYNPSVSTVQSPTCTQATANRYTITAVLLYSPAPAASAPGKFLPFFSRPSHHEDELEQRPSGLYVQRNRPRVFGYRAPRTLVKAGR